MYACLSTHAQVKALIYNNPGCGQLFGNNAVETVDGVAKFTDLMFEKEARNYRIQFLAGPDEAPLRMISSPFQVVHGRINLGNLDGEIRTLPPQRAGTVLPDVEVFVEHYNIQSKTWSLSDVYEGVMTVASPLPACERRVATLICRPSPLLGTLDVQVTGGRATFTDLTIVRAQAGGPRVTSVCQHARYKLKHVGTVMRTQVACCRSASN